MANNKQRSRTNDIPIHVIPEELPIIPINDTVVFPHLILPLMFSNEGLIQLTDESLSANKMVGLFSQKPVPVRDSSEAEGMPQPDGELYSVGTAASIIKMLRFPNGAVRVVVQGLARIQLKKIIADQPFIRARVEYIDVDESKTLEIEALMRNAVTQFQKVVQLTQHLPNEMQLAALNIEEPGKLADFITANLNINMEERQRVLETINVKKRLEMVNRYLNKEVKVLELGNKIQANVKDEMDKDQREYYLREQMQAIRKELGEETNTQMEVEELKKKIIEANMPEEAKKAADKELERLAMMPPAAAEYTVSRTYIDWLVTLPWAKISEDNLDLGKAENVLREDHYGLNKVKERIIEYLAVRKLKSDMKGPIFCFVGPPGVGKTSLGRSIARALDRKFVRFSVGGIRDEAEIRGHRRTYIGSLPGRIIQGMRNAGTNNPVFMLDEIDKVGTDFRGDPASALLEVLDPEQNKEFSDHYLEVKFDLSKVMFITTANYTHPIPSPLLDRMEVLELPGYTLEEKMAIARNYLLPRQLSEHGIDGKRLSFTEDSLKTIVRDYTREAGVRNLEREIATICRKVAKDVALGSKKRVTITPKHLAKFLGAIKFLPEVSMHQNEVGITTGLAWTQVGGSIIFIEATKMKGTKGLALTGSLGDVMKESAHIALSFVRSQADKLGVEPSFFSENEIHLHVPAGAVPKDGPSAGVAMATTLASLASGRAVRRDIAMTGEITLHGKVLAIGGVKEKVLAARQAGIMTVILPEENRKDLEDVPDVAKKELTFKFVAHIDDVLKMALMPDVVRKKLNKTIAGTQKVLNKTNGARLADQPLPVIVPN